MCVGPNYAAHGPLPMVWLAEACSPWLSHPTSESEPARATPPTAWLTAACSPWYGLVSREREGEIGRGRGREGEASRPDWDPLARQLRHHWQRVDTAAAAAAAAGPRPAASGGLGRPAAGGRFPYSL